MNNKPGNKPPAGKPAGKPATKPATKPEAKPQDKPAGTEYQVGDEISYASAQGMLYGTVIKIIKDPSSPAVEVQFEDGRKEIKKSRDRAMRLLRRATGKSELDEQRGERKKLKDYDIEEVRRSEQRRGSRH
jgi:hypothetical protein